MFDFFFCSDFFLKGLQQKIVVLQVLLGSGGSLRGGSGGNGRNVKMIKNPRCHFTIEDDLQCSHLFIFGHFFTFGHLGSMTFTEQVQQQKSHPRGFIHDYRCIVFPQVYILA